MKNANSSSDSDKSKGTKVWKPRSFCSVVQFGLSCCECLRVNLFNFTTFLENTAKSTSVKEKVEYRTSTPTRTTFHVGRSQNWKNSHVTMENPSHLISSVIKQRRSLVWFLGLTWSPWRATTEPALTWWRVTLPSSRLGSCSQKKYWEYLIYCSNIIKTQSFTDVYCMLHNVTHFMCAA